MTSPTRGRTWPALAAAGTTTLLWASAFVSIRDAAASYSPGALALGRLLSGSATLALMLAATRTGWPPRAAWPGIACSGVLWFGVYMVTLNWGEQLVDAGTAAMVVSLGPVLITLLSARLLGEGLPRPLLWGTAVAFTGALTVGLATADTDTASVAGVLLCLAAAATYALGVVSQKPALRHATALQVSAFGCMVGALTCLPFAPTLAREVAHAPASATANMVYLGVFPTAVAFTTWAFALARMPAGRLGATTYLVPVLVVALSWLVLGEVPHPLALLGGALCLAGVALSRRPSTPPT
ncbi:DMT family transporter [Thermobifida cellulosilytica]|uniref:Membrane protein n=1 Tax=Thermobifida cellulosilytica TB100 TaxID=665004 RepID=A0A147KIM7_THECS|nr:DMT family transporter [Thermobifida cellulosilytica]KUP97152.1 membrane protein [Thermobifida cellulosilytica TB100]